MDNDKILNITKECFRENFQDVEKIQEQSNLHSHNVTFSSNIIGSEKRIKLQLYINNIDILFTLIKTITTFSSEHIARLQPTKTNYTNDKYFKLLVQKFSSNGEDILYTREIHIDENCFNLIEKSIKYDGSKLETDLNSILTDIRNDKIDKLNK